MFCSQPPRKVKGIEQKLANVEINDFEKEVRKYIEWMDVSKLLAQFTRVNISTKVKYHACCSIKYQTEAEGKANQERRLAGTDLSIEDSTTV